MPRIARIIVPGVAHHITQRGNRRQITFFEEGDYKTYLKLLFKWMDHFNVEIEAYCLMPNHVHLVLRPADRSGMTKALIRVHQRYTRIVNYRFGWKGCLWQGRFFSVPLDEDYYENAIRYVELNPVRAQIAPEPNKYRWSSAATRNAHSGFYDKPLELEVIRKMTSSGRPQCSKKFAREILQKTGIDINPKKTGLSLIHI